MTYQEVKDESIHNFILKVDNFYINPKVQAIIDHIIKNVPEKLTDLEKAYYIYVKFEEAFIVFPVTRLFPRGHPIKIAVYNDCVNENLEAVCRGFCLLYQYVLDIWGVEVECIRRDPENDSSHIDSIIKTKDGKIYFMKPDNVYVGKIRLKEKGGFGATKNCINVKKDSYAEYIEKYYNKQLSVVSADELKEMDQKLKFIVNGLYAEDMIGQLKIDLTNKFGRNMNAVQEKLEYLVYNNLDKFFTVRGKLGYYERTKIYVEMVENIFDCEEKKRIKMYDLFYGSIKKEKFISVIKFKKDRRDIYYIFSEKRNQYILISEQELVQEIENKNLVETGRQLLEHDETVVP